MKLISTEITDLKSEFEGGKALSVDWYAILRRAGDKLLGQIYPETLKRSVPVYGGISKDLLIYYCPADVLVPAELFPNTGDRESPYTYKPPSHFYAHPEEKSFTIEYINKVRFIVIRHGKSTETLEIDDMEEVGTKTGTAGSIALNDFNYIEGSAAIQGSFDDSGKYISDNFDSATDISEFGGAAKRRPSSVNTATAGLG